jgi:MFS family permease
MNPVILKVGLISFFADLSSELLYPITPLFLTSVLHASMTSVGLIEGCAEFTASILKGWAGKESDLRKVRRPFVWGGYLISTLAKAVIGISTSWVGVLFARSLDRVGKGVRTAPRDALIAESVKKEELGLAFGIHRGMDTLGAVIGPLLALGILAGWKKLNLRMMYFLAILPGLIAVWFATRLPEPARKTKARESGNSGRLLELPRRYFVFMTGWGLFSLANSSDAFLLLRAGGNGNSISKTIWMYCLFNLVYALSSPLLGKVSDRYGKEPILKLSLLVFLGVYAGFGVGINPWVLFPLYGVFMAMSEGVGKALVAELVPEGRVSDLGATAQGFFGMVSGITALLASVIAGVLWDRIGPEAPFLYGAAGAGGALIVFLFFR